MATIEADSVTLSQAWGTLRFNDYLFNGVKVDFQDLMVAVAEARAVAVEGEITPMSVRMRLRNKYLDELGNALAELTKIEASFDSDDDPSLDQDGWMTDTTGTLLKDRLLISCREYSSDWDWQNPTADMRPKNSKERADFYHVSWRTGSSYSANKKTIAGMIQKVKSAIDSQNNAAQTDMSRLQSLVDRRDESYSTATNLMTNISDTRSNLIRNL